MIILALYIAIRVCVCVCVCLYVCVYVCACLYVCVYSDLVHPKRRGLSDPCADLVLGTATLLPMTTA